MKKENRKEEVKELLKLLRMMNNKEKIGILVTMKGLKIYADKAPLW